jgi:AcrR family transcriptional regulator
MGTTDRASRADATRARLLDAAVRAFSARGFHGTTTREIAAASGLSSAAVYVHHKSKEELLYEISKAGHKETLAIVQDALATAHDPVEQFRALVTGYVLFHARQHTLVRVITYEMAALSPEHLAEIQAIRRKIDRAIHNTIKAGVDSGAFDTPDPRMAAIAVESLGIDIARWYRPRGSWTPEQLASKYTGMALRLVGNTRP